MKEYAVIYTLSDAQAQALKKLTSAINSATGRDMDAEEVFQSIMTIGSAHEIDDKLKQTQQLIKKGGT